MRLQAGGALRQAFERRQEHHQVGEEHDEFAGGDPAGNDLRAAVPEERRARHGDQELPDDLDGPAPPPREHFLARQEVERRAVPDALEARACEAAHHADAAERLAGGGVHLAHLLAHIAEHRAQPADPGAVRERDRGEEEQGAKEQAPVGERQDGEDAHELDDGAPRVVEERKDQFGHAARVLADDGADAAGAKALHAVERKAHGVVERAPSHGGLQELDRAGGLVAAGNSHHHAAGAHGHHRARQPAEELRRCLCVAAQHPLPRAGERLAAEDVVDHHLGGGRRDEAEDGRDRDRCHGERDAGAISAGESKELTEQRAERARSLGALLPVPGDGELLPPRVGPPFLELPQVVRVAASARGLGAGHPAILGVPRIDSQGCRSAMLAS